VESVLLSEKTQVKNLLCDKGSWKMLSFHKNFDHRGALVALESQNEIPFDIERIYYIFDTLPAVKRGLHAHKKLEQVLICLSGSCRVRVDNGYYKASYDLDSREKGLYVKGLTWREMSQFSPDCVLLVLASEKYNESDYVRDYQTFISLVGSMALKGE
jgi:dTDP-4-dehydrorhamnose 3,5-epimerase-like enzyme